MLHLCKQTVGPVGVCVFDGCSVYCFGIIGYSVLVIVLIPVYRKCNRVNYLLGKPADRIVSVGCGIGQKSALYLNLFYQSQNRPLIDIKITVAVGLGDRRTVP